MTQVSMLKAEQDNIQRALDALHDWFLSQDDQADHPDTEPVGPPDSERQPPPSAGPAAGPAGPSEPPPTLRTGDKPPENQRQPSPSAGPGPQAH